MNTENSHNSQTSYDYTNRATNGISASIVLLEETKLSLESNFLIRYFRIGLLYAFDFGLVLLSLVVLFSGLYYVTYFVGRLDSLSNNLPNASKDFFEMKVIISHAESLAYIAVANLAILLFVLSRFFRRSRKRASFLKKVTDNLKQVIENLKAEKGSI